MSALAGGAGTRVDLAPPRSGRYRIRFAAETDQPCATEPGAPMRSASLLLVFVLAKAAMIWGHAAPVTGWWLVAYVWQDAMAALAFAAFDIGLRKMGAAAWIAWMVYWAAAIYAAINIPVGSVVS